MPRGSLVALGLVVFAAFGGGMAIDRMLATGDGRAPLETPDAAPAPRAAPEERQSAPARPRRANQGVSAPSAALDAAGEKLAAAALAAPSEAMPSGEGGISGTVRTAEGTPLPGIEVVATAQQPPEWAKENDGKRWEDIPIETRVRQFVRGERWREVSKRTAKSGEDGRYQVAGLGDLLYQVGARSEDYNFRVADGQRSDRVKPGGTVDFIAGPEVRVEFDMRLPDGSVPTRAMITILRGDGGSSGYGWSPTSRRVGLPPGKSRLTVTGGDDDRYAAPAFELSVSRDMAQQAVGVRLAARRGIIAHVLGPKGFESLPPRFYVCPVEGNEPSDAEVRASPNEEDRWRYNRDGGRDERGVRFVRMDLAAGRYVVAAAIVPGALTRTTVDVGESVVEVDLAIPAPDTSSFVEARIRDPEAKPLQGVNVRWEFEGENESGGYETNVVSRPEGVYLVRIVGPDERPSNWNRSGKTKPDERRWFLVAQNNVFAPLRVPVRPGADRTVDMQFPVQVSLAVTVSGFTAADQNVFQVRCTGGRNSQSQGLSSDGTTRLSRLAPGTYVLSLRARCGSRSGGDFVAARQEMALGPGENTATFAAPVLTRVTIETSAAHANEWAQLMGTGSDPNDRGAASLELDMQGRAEPIRLPPGDYEVRCGQDKKSFRVPETTVVRF